MKSKIYLVINFTGSIFNICHPEIQQCCSIPNHSRTIYQEKITCRYWYVDNLHEGKSAHLEVFDKTGQHIGEADLEGHIDETKQDPTKNIHLK